MTRRRFIADEVYGERAALTGQHAYHLCRVLRARVGQEFDIVAGAAVRRGRIAGVSEERVEFELLEELGQKRRGGARPIQVSSGEARLSATDAHSPVGDTHLVAGDTPDSTPNE